LVGVLVGLLVDGWLAWLDCWLALSAAGWLDGWLTAGWLGGWLTAGWMVG